MFDIILLSKLYQINIDYFDIVKLNLLFKGFEFSETVNKKPVWIKDFSGFGPPSGPGAGANR